MFLLLDYLRDDDKQYERFIKDLMKVIITTDQKADIFMNAMEEFKKPEV
jgi:hypothetical protein